MIQSIQLTPRESEAMVGVLEEALHVHRRHQFFVWAQGRIATVLPHKVLVCGSYQRQRRKVVLEVFNSVPLQPATLTALADSDSMLLRSLTQTWILGGGRAAAVDPATLRDEARRQAMQMSDESGCSALLLHGVARPQRLSEVETFFVLASVDAHALARRLQLLEILLPHLHSTWRRVESVERSLHITPGRGSLDMTIAAQAHTLVTDRERQILAWMREGKSNPQIGELLNISPLTVKNHVQKILRKLNAANRAQAVAHAISMNLLIQEGSALDAA